jgi:hypothetical protein
MALASLLFLYTLIFEVPRYTAAPGSMTFRTQVFEPLAIAALAWLVPGQATPNWLGHASRYLLGCVFHRVWSGPLPRARTDRNPDTPVDSMACVLDCILRGWFRRCWLKPRLQFPAGLGRRQHRPVCHLGCHPSSSQNNSWALRGKWPARSRRVVESVHRHCSVGRFMGSGFEWSSSGLAENLKGRARWISWY